VLTLQLGAWLAEGGCHLLKQLLHLVLSLMLLLQGPWQAHQSSPPYLHLLLLLYRHSPPLPRSLQLCLAA
jgi:hypothetical protein